MIKIEDGEIFIGTKNQENNEQGNLKRIISKDECIFFENKSLNEKVLTKIDIRKIQRK